jgi:lipopolysaccharide/colanic/teichoic acid biosynthesis glycosyltransferase
LEPYRLNGTLLASSVDECWPKEEALRNYEQISSPLPRATWEIERDFLDDCKRALDTVLASILLALCSPLLLVLAWLVRRSSPGPAFFWQTRIGQYGGRFRMLKLRTMIEGSEDDEDDLTAAGGHPIFLKPRNDRRVTPVGRFLRRTSLDELPQLVNVLRGEMSLVGPRPLLERDLERMPRGRYVERFRALPGMTGLWQVSGRSLLSDEERLQLDLRYVENWSLELDLWILLRTLPAVISGRGAI